LDVTGDDLRQADHHRLVQEPDHREAFRQTFTARLPLSQTKMWRPQPREFAPGSERGGPGRLPRGAGCFEVGRDRLENRGFFHTPALAEVSNQTSFGRATSVTEWVHRPVSASVVAFAAMPVNSPSAGNSNRCPFQDTRAPLICKTGGGRC